MINIIIWLGVLLCGNPTHTASNHGNCPLLHTGSGTVTPNNETGGELGGPPKPPPPPPPPPTGGY